MFSRTVTFQIEPSRSLLEKIDFAQIGGGF